MSERNGRITIVGDRAVLTFERRLAHPIDVVWSAITDPSHRRKWLGDTTIDARQGGMIDMVPSGPPLPPDQKRMTGRILVWDPPHVFEHEWRQSIVDDGVVRYELRPDGDGALLRFTHRGLGVPDANGFLPGTHAFLDRLQTYLAGDEMPYWSVRYQEVARWTAQWTPMDTVNLAIAYHSGFGHTGAMAEAVARGARGADARVSMIAVDTMTESHWPTLDLADGVVFGSATYMGNVPATYGEARGEMESPSELR